MKLTLNDRDTVEKLHLISGLKKEDIRVFFESLFTLVVLDYLDKDDTTIPFLGKLSVKYLKESYEGNLKSAELEVIIDADEPLKRNIGQIIDGESCDIEKIFERKIQNSLDDYLES